MIRGLRNLVCGIRRAIFGLRNVVFGAFLPALCAFASVRDTRYRLAQRRKGAKKEMRSELRFSVFASASISPTSTTANYTRCSNRVNHIGWLPSCSHRGGFLRAATGVAPLVQPPSNAPYYPRCTRPHYCVHTLGILLLSLHVKLNFGVGVTIHLRGKRRGIIPRLRWPGFEFGLFPIPQSPASMTAMAWRENRRRGRV